jgi:hypothetical protein
VTFIAVIMTLIVGLVLAVTFLARLLTHHSVFRARPIRTTRNATSANDRTQPRRAAR